jgi:glycine dehydrogenase
MQLKHQPVDVFEHRHNAPDSAAIAAMLRTIGVASVEQLIDETVPPAIRLPRELDLPAALSERAFLAKFKQIASLNKVFKSYIGLGYHDTTLPPVIQRNILENPGLVHGLHALPGRNCPGPPRSPHQLPDHGN